MNSDGRVTQIVSHETPLPLPLNYVRHGAFLPNGELIFVDNGGHTVRILRSNGDVDILAGTFNVSGHRDGDALEAQFKGPWGIAVDLEGNIIVSDQYNHCIRRISLIKWRPSNHHRFPHSFRSRVKSMMILWRMNDCIIHCLPRDILFEIFEFIHHYQTGHSNCMTA